MIKMLLIFTLFLSQAALSASNTEIVKQFVEASNQKDIDAMLSLAVIDMRWMSVTGNEISVETSSHAALRESMAGYFKAVPTAHSKIRKISSSGPFVHTVEEAFWRSGEIEKSQCSMAMYELSEEKIVNVWYFAAHPCLEKNRSIRNAE